MAVSDIYSSVYSSLGPWTGINHRRCVMLEVLRVLAGFESSWNWNEGVMSPGTIVQSAEAGAFQVSADSMAWGIDLKTLVQDSLGTLDPISFP